MAKNPCFLALDLGAESGRAVVGEIGARNQLSIHEIHRFSNGPVRVLDSLHWDALSLWREMVKGVGLAHQRHGKALVSLGVDTWGVDYGLLGKDDELLGNPHNYRDPRTDGMMEKVFRKVSKKEIYETTGIQFMQLNTLYQLAAMAEGKATALKAAESLLMMPDLFNFWFTGRKANEFTIATTTQCYNPRTRTWASGMLRKLGIPTHMFGDIVQPCTKLGRLRPSVAEAAGCGRLAVIAPATHDTGSAVAAVPVEKGDFIYLSSGTWSLMGVESAKPIITAESLKHSITNEGGMGGTFRFLKNIMGLWLVQECRRQWEKEGTALDYATLAKMAAEAPAFGPVVDPGDSRFLAPGGMPARIQGFCRETGQRAPAGKGAIARCALESLALEYRRVAESLERITGRRLPVIHIIGGGSQNRLLNQMTADATGRTVVAGPVEATAIGNVLAQALATGYIGSLKEGRAIVKTSFEVKRFEPRNTAPWDAAYERYRKILGR